MKALYQKPDRERGTLALVLCLLLQVHFGQSDAATFYGPVPYLSADDIPAGLYANGAPEFLEDFEDGELDPRITVSPGAIIPPGYEGVIDSVDADDGEIDGSGLKGHSWFSLDGVVTFVLPPGTTAAGVVWTDGTGPIVFSAFGPGNVPLGSIGPFNDISDGQYTGATAEDRFFGVRHPAGVESISISNGGGAIEVDHVQYGFGFSQGAASFAMNASAFDSGGGTSAGGLFVMSGTITRTLSGPLTGGGFGLTGGFASLVDTLPPPSPEPDPGAPEPELAADQSTPIPGGAGNFTSLPFAPSLSGDNLAFYGTGSNGQQGFYLSNLGFGSQRGTGLIADRNTPIPGGVGSFQSFGTEAGIIIVSGSHAVFGAGGSGGQRGIYGSALSSTQTGSPMRVVDLSTPIPGGAGNFTDLPWNAGLDGNTVVFTGHGSAGQRGIYAATMTLSEVGAPFRIADTTTPVPDGTGNFTGFPLTPSISGDLVVFTADGAVGQQGVYAAAITATQVGAPIKIADTNTPIPDGTGNFQSFGAEAGIIIVSGKNAVFGGLGSGGQQGIYASAISPPRATLPIRIADTATAIPGGTGNFTSFGEASVSETDLAFIGHGLGGQTGIYDRTGGQLMHVISVGQSINGKTIASLGFSRGGLYGDPVAFQATFTDGSQGIFRIAVTPPDTLDLNIIEAEWIGNDLQISFTSLVGSTYVFETNEDLSAESWAAVAGPTLPGTGGIVQATIAGALTGTRQFYRVRRLP